MKTIAQQLNIKSFPFEIYVNDNLVYFEYSTGYIVDNRPKVKEFSMDEIAKALGIPVEQLKIKK